MAGRTLIFSFDGTGNEPSNVRRFHKDESISNIGKLHAMLGGHSEKSSDPVTTPAGTKQYVHYHKGIGTRGRGVLGKLINLWRNLINQAIAPTWGDVKDILKEAHKQFDEYQCTLDDKVVIFGFSRGAALARKFASQLLDKHEDCRVSFLGVFDTVAAMTRAQIKQYKLSTDVLFENGTLNERIDRAVHLLSLDEDRGAFTPTLINRDESNPDRIFEVWFPGAHSDVGGGYWFDGLSDLALEFMIEECRKALKDPVTRKHHIEIVKEAEKIPGLPFKPPKPPKDDDPTVDDVHLYPLINGVLHEPPLLTRFGRKPRQLQVWRDDEPSERPEDVPLLHQSVKERFDTMTGYRPFALRGQRFQMLLRDGTRTEPLEGISGLRNYVLPPENPSPESASADTETHPAD